MRMLPSARSVFPQISISLSAKLSYLNFNQLEVVSRYSDRQFQIGDNYSYSFNVRPKIWKSLCLNIHLIPNAITVIQLADNLCIIFTKIQMHHYIYNRNRIICKLVHGCHFVYAN